MLFIWKKELRATTARKWPTREHFRAWDSRDLLARDQLLYSFADMRHAHAEMVE